MMNRLRPSLKKYGTMLFCILLGGLALADSDPLKKEPTVHLPRRISGQIVDLGIVHPIYMVSGMATLIEIPDAVTGIRIGNPDAVKYFQPKKPENEVTLVLQDHQAKATNLIIRSGKKKYVFDIIPSKTIHQDTVEVVGSFGGAEIDSNQAVLIDSSEDNHAKKASDKK